MFAQQPVHPLGHARVRQSELEPQRFDFEAMVGDLGAVMDDAEVETCDLLGCAWCADRDRLCSVIRSGGKLVLVNSFAWMACARTSRDGLAQLADGDEPARMVIPQKPVGRDVPDVLYFPHADAELIEWHNSPASSGQCRGCRR